MSFFSFSPPVHYNYGAKVGVCVMSQIRQAFLKLFYYKTNNKGNRERHFILLAA